MLEKPASLGSKRKSPVALEMLPLCVLLLFGLCPPSRGPCRTTWAGGNNAFIFGKFPFFLDFSPLFMGERKQGQLDPINSSRYKEAKFGWGDLFLVKEVILFSD